MQVHVLHLAPAQALGTEWVHMSRTSELMGRVVAGSGGEELRGQSARGRAARVPASMGAALALVENQMWTLGQNHDKNWKEAARKLFACDE